jgi:hypothetical protein
LEILGIHKRIILKWILEKCGVEYISLLNRPRILCSLCERGNEPSLSLKVGIFITV